MNPFANDIATAAQQQNQTEEKRGEQRPTPEEGFGLCRFVGYVETGMHPRKPFKGQAKSPANTVTLFFELVSKKWMHTDETGKQRGVLVQETLPMIQNSKSKFFMLLERMRYGRPNITHYAQMLGEGFTVELRHNHVKDEAGKITRTYLNITRADGTYSLGAPVRQDAETGMSEPYTVPDATVPLRLLLQSNPTRQQWDSIYIEGSRKVKDERGQEVERTNNWLQEKCLSALDFSGSKLEELLGMQAGLSAPPPKQVPVQAPEPKQPQNEQGGTQPAQQDTEFWSAFESGQSAELDDAVPF